MNQAECDDAEPMRLCWADLLPHCSLFRASGGSERLQPLQCINCMFPRLGTCLGCFFGSPSLCNVDEWCSGALVPEAMCVACSEPIASR
jgi:hypothetical protein